MMASLTATLNMFRFSPQSIAGYLNMHLDMDMSYRIKSLADTTKI